MTDEERELHKVYKERFGERLCLDFFESRDPVEILKECLRTGKPYDSGKEYDPDCKY